MSGLIDARFWIGFIASPTSHVYCLLRVGWRAVRGGRLHRARDLLRGAEQLTWVTRHEVDIGLTRQRRQIDCDTP